MTLSGLFRQGSKLVADNAPALLTALGVSGTLTTAYLAGKASYKASKIIHAVEAKGGTSPSRKQRLKERVPLVWKLYIPPIATGAITVGAIVCSNRISAKRAAAAYSLLSVTQQAFTEYREEITNVMGEKKETGIRDKIVQRKIENDSPEVHNITVPDNMQLCCELHTGRYFASTMESLRKAMNDLNRQMTFNKWADLNDWYHLIDLEATQFSDQWGWDMQHDLMDLEFTSALTRDGKPVLAFRYNYLIPVHRPACDLDFDENFRPDD